MSWQRAINARAIRIARDGRVAVHRQIAQQIESLVKSGALEPGQRLPSHSELAQLLDVHPLTVGRSYSELQLRGVIVQQQGRGSFVHKQGDGAAQSAASVVVLLPPWEEIASSTNLLYMNHQFLAGLEQGFQEHGIGLTILTVPDSRIGTDAQALARQIRARHQGAVSYVGSYLPILTQLARDHFPAAVCNLNAFVPGLSTIVYDRRKALYDATAHLIAQGRRRIGFLGPRNDDPADNPKFNGYLTALEDAGLVYDSSTLLRTSKAEPSSRRAVIERAIAEGRLGDGIVVDGMEAAPLVLELLKAHGIAVPGDVAVFGFDEPINGGRTDPPLTWCYIPRYEMGQAASQIIAAQVQQGRGEVVHQCLTASLVLGASCGHPQPGSGVMPRPEIKFSGATAELAT